MDYRIKKDFKVFTFPKGFEEEDRGLKSCCPVEKKLASSTDSAISKNDVIGVVIKISDPSDTVVISIEKCGTGVLANLGEVLSAPQDSLLVGFIFKCREYILTSGPGKYIVKINTTISGISSSFVWGEYSLKEFTVYNAKGTVRIMSAFNSKYAKLNMDFTGSNYIDSIRFNGLFGNRKTNTVIKNLIDTGRKVLKSTRENVNSYLLLSDPIFVRTSKRLLDWHFINEDYCLITDHNSSNHEYLNEGLLVALEEVSDPEYRNGSRLVSITATFGDRDKIDKNYYNLM